MAEKSRKYWKNNQKWTKNIKFQRISANFYTLTIFKKYKVNEKYYWYIRAISYFVTLLLVLFIVLNYNWLLFLIGIPMQVITILCFNFKKTK